MCGITVHSFKVIGSENVNAKNKLNNINKKVISNSKFSNIFWKFVDFYSFAKTK